MTRWPVRHPGQGSGRDKSEGTPSPGSTRGWMPSSRRLIRVHPDYHRLHQALAVIIAMRAVATLGLEKASIELELESPHDSRSVP